MERSTRALRQKSQSPVWFRSLSLPEAGTVALIPQSALPRLAVDTLFRAKLQCISRLSSFTPRQPTPRNEGYLICRLQKAPHGRSFLLFL